MKAATKPEVQIVSLRPVRSFDDLMLRASTEFDKLEEEASRLRTTVIAFGRQLAQSGHKENNFNGVRFDRALADARVIEKAKEEIESKLRWEFLGNFKSHLDLIHKLEAKIKKPWWNS
jgi:hypothetical protein